MEWRVYTMSELWDLLNSDGKIKVIKPKFPTRRWGDITTELATSDKRSLEKGIILLKERGYIVRKRIDKDLTKKWKSLGKKMYRIEIKE